MRTRLAYIDNDPNSEFMAFSITAISSPEGSYQRSLELARMRAGTAKETIMKSLQPATVSAMRDSITVSARVESWERVAEPMEADSLSAAEVREAIEQSPKSVEAQYRKIAGLPNYRSVIIPEYMPKLRRVEYSFSYSTLRFLSDQEIQQLYQEDYKRLTEYEFWRLYAKAETDEEREKICRQALVTYPKFILMANELAVILIKKKQSDMELLKPFLNDSTPQPILHNQVIALLAQMDYVHADSIASLLKDNPMTADVKAITGAYNGDYETAYERFGAKGGVNEVVLLLALKRNQEALDKADELPEEVALTYYLRAVASNRLDKLIEAFANLKKAFSIDPWLKDIARIDGDVTDLMQQMEDEKKEKEEEAKKKAAERESATGEEQVTNEDSINDETEKDGTEKTE